MPTIVPRQAARAYGPLAKISTARCYERQAVMSAMAPVALVATQVGR
jgi:hypothetical protein